MQPEIRLFTPADSAGVLAMLSAIAALHCAGRPDIFLDSGAKYTQADLEAIAADPNKRIFIADLPDQPCAGYLFCQLRDANQHPPVRPVRTLWIDDLFTRPDCRSRGVGRALIEFAAAFARQMDCARVELNVWGFNQNAAAFYEQCGFHVQRQILELPL